MIVPFRLPLARPPLSRRALVLAPFLLVACGGDPSSPPPASRVPYAPLRYAYLPPLALNIARLTVADDFTPPKGETEVGGSSPVSIVDTLAAMARDRLKPAAREGTGTFRIQTASITRRGDTLTGTLAVRLDVRSGDDSGFIEARVTAPKTGADQDLKGTIHELLKALMDDMNIEVEYQIKRELRAWLVEAKPPEAKPSGPKPSGAKPPGPKPSDAKPSGEKPADAKPPGPKPAGTKPSGAKPSAPKRPSTSPSRSRPDPESPPPPPRA